MNVISDDRALEQWKAVVSQPAKFLSRFHKRFLDEQSALAQAVASMFVDLSRRNDLAKLRIAQASAEEFVAAITVSAASIAEVIRREAGRALRPVSADEVEQHFRSLLDLLDRIKGVEHSAWMEAVADIRQANLLQGTIIGQVTGGHLLNNPNLVAPAFRLIIEALDAVAEEPGSDAERAAFWSADRVEEALAVSGDPMRRSALAWADLHRAEMTPRLLAELQAWADDPDEALDDDLALGTHAMFLLAAWRELAAWPALRGIFTLPEDIVNGLLGDFATMYGDVLLASTVHGQQAELRAIVENEAADEFVRDAALRAMAVLVAWGELPRADLVDYLRDLLTGRLHAEPSSYVWVSVFETAASLEAWELRPELDAAGARSAIDSSLLEAGFLDQAQADAPGSLWAKFTSSHLPMQDVAESTVWLDERWEFADGLDEPLEGDESADGEALPDQAGQPEPIDIPGYTDPPIAEPSEPYVAPPKIGRNDPCPCGSGKKYKKCCGR